jgi:hypothetical protein
MNRFSNNQKSPWKLKHFLLSKYSSLLATIKNKFFNVLIGHPWYGCSRQRIHHSWQGSSSKRFQSFHFINFLNTSYNPRVLNILTTIHLICILLISAKGNILSLYSCLYNIYRRSQTSSNRSRHPSAYKISLHRYITSREKLWFQIFIQGHKNSSIRNI